MAYGLIVGFIVAGSWIIRFTVVRFSDCRGAAMMSGIALLNLLLSLVLRFRTRRQKQAQEKDEI